MRLTGTGEAMPEGERIDLEREAELWRESLRWPEPATPAGAQASPEPQEPTEPPATHESAAQPSDPGLREVSQRSRPDRSHQTAWRLAVATPIAQVVFLLTHVAVGIPTVWWADSYHSAKEYTYLGAVVIFGIHGLVGVLVAVPVLVFTLGYGIDRWGRTRPRSVVVAVSGAIPAMIAVGIPPYLLVDSRTPLGEALAYAVMVGVPPVITGLATPLLLRVALRRRWVRVMFVVPVLIIYGLAVWGIVAWYWPA